MKSGKISTVNKETSSILINIFKFFMEHTNIEFDGEKKIAKVKYSGPNGWKFSFQSSFEKPLEIIETNSKEDHDNE
ncbi:MAG: hypothetical protein ACI4U3_03750 [Traorella sp.]